MLTTSSALIVLCTRYVIFFSLNIQICSNGVKEKRILQTIKTHKPSSFTILNFEGKIETLLIFVENGKNLQIYEYKGIQSFHRVVSLY